MYIMDQVEDFASKHIEDIIKKENVTLDCIEMLGELVDVVKDVSEIRKNNSTTYAMDSYSPEKTVEMTRRYADSMPRDMYGRSMPYNNMNYGNMNYGAPNHMTYGNMYGNAYGNKEDMIQKMRQMLAEAQSEQERQAIQDCINKLNS